MTDKQEGTEWSAVITANSQAKPILGGSSSQSSRILRPGSWKCLDFKAKAKTKSCFVLGCKLDDKLSQTIMDVSVSD